jgi:membrane protease subunit HflC
MKKLVTVLVVIGVLVILFLITGPFYVINEGEQAVVVQFGKILRVDTEAGLKIKVPFVDNVVKYPKKIMAWDGEAQRLPTAENQFIWVDTTARWKITDPKLFYESVGTLTAAASRLDDVIDSEVRKIISRNQLREAVRNSNVINEIERVNVYQTQGEEGTEELSEDLYTDRAVQDEISKGRMALSEDMLAGAGTITPQYGIELIDIVIRQIKYSDDLTESVYRRMIAERNRIAQAFRSDGEGQKARWMGQMQRELNKIQSEAYETSQNIKGRADAAAANIYASAYRQDAEFYRFWKSIESYRQILPKFQKTLTTEPDYFDYLYDDRGR